MAEPSLRRVLRIGKEAGRIYRKALHRQQHQENAPILGICLLVAILILLMAVVAQADIDLDRWADAIRRAEGNPNYGILSIPCNSEAQCRQYCKNTVYNTLVKYRDQRCKEGESDIDCLARRYAPIGAENDPTGLNKNWKKNVLAFLEG